MDFFFSHYEIKNILVGKNIIWEILQVGNVSGEAAHQ